MTRLLLSALLLLPAAAFADDTPKAKPNTLTPQEIAEGWILLFDGETSFGWKGDAKAADGEMRIAGQAPASPTSVLGLNFELAFEYKADAGGGGQFLLQDGRDHLVILPLQGTGAWRRGTLTYRFEAGRRSPFYTWKTHKTSENATTRFGTTPPELAFRALDGSAVSIRSVRARPSAATPLFNGKDLSGWKEQSRGGKSSKWTVAEGGVLRCQDGPGDLQTEGQWADFVLQAEVKTHGEGLNSGFFFRAIPGEYQNGYEAQINNKFKDGDRAKPADFGTGAIYRRIAARRIVANDNEWFTLTVVAHGNHIATWVNGIQVVDWTDDRPADENPRKGSKTGKGCISIQGHDPTTDLSFRNIRLAELSAPAGKK